ncbi:MAG: FtsX-like permease family protein [Pseudomonadales bacterium]|nr:FtsX-like permease family protein [Pseudomonadales bacterium]
MFYNYLITALFNLKRQPVFSIIKIASLVLGLACSILVIMHVQFTYSYNKHFPNWENTHRLVTSFTTDQRMHTPMIAEGYAPPLEIDYPQIESMAMIRPDEAQFERNNQSSPNSMYWVDPEIIDILSLEFVQGDPDTALDGTNSVVLNESTAIKYFGEEDPMGQILTANDQFEVRVTGIMRDLPINSTLDLQMLVAAETGRQVINERFMASPAWAGFGGTELYLTLPNEQEYLSISADLEDFVQRNVPDNQAQFVNQIDITLELEPIADIYLSPRQAFRNQGGNRAQILAGLVVFAILILITSAINFANLSLSQIQQRGKEIGVRKTLGADRKQIATQFLFESMLLTVVALLIAIPIVYFAVPIYTALTNTDFTFENIVQTSYAGWIALFVLATGFVSGLFPALSISRYQPAIIIRGIISGNRLSKAMRSGITVVQFTLSTTLILVAIAIGLQINHLGEMELGFNKQNLVILDSTYDQRNPDEFNYDALVNDLEQHPGIISVARSGVAPPETGAYNPWRRPHWEQTEMRPVSHYAIDTNYIDTYEFELVAGRGFSEEFPADFMPQGQPDQEQTYGVVITEAALGNFQFPSAEESLDEIMQVGNIQFRAIGVIGDFRLAGGMEDVLRSTSILRGFDSPLRVLSIRIDSNQTDSVLNHIDEVWWNHRPDVPVERSFYEQTYNGLIYDATNGINTASIFASLVTIGIAALGLYALAFYTSQRRTKEVGIRKVLGATSGSIIGLLTWDFVKPVLIACAIACITGYIAMEYIFAQFTSSPEMPFTIYFGVAIISIVIAVLTVAMQCLRTANSDPIQSLRYE